MTNLETQHIFTIFFRIPCFSHTICPFLVRFFTISDKKQIKEKNKQLKQKESKNRKKFSSKKESSKEIKHRKNFFPKNNIQNEKEDSLHLHKFRKILKARKKVSQQQIAQYLGISQSDLFIKLIEWNEKIPFKIDGDFVIVDHMEAFLHELDKDFENWDEKEVSKEGKF